MFGDSFERQVHRSSWLRGPESCPLVGIRKWGIQRRFMKMFHRYQLCFVGKYLRFRWELGGRMPPFLVLIANECLTCHLMPASIILLLHHRSEASQSHFSNAVIFIVEWMKELVEALRGQKSGPFQAETNCGRVHILPKVQFWIGEFNVGNYQE